MRKNFKPPSRTFVHCAVNDMNPDLILSADWHLTDSTPTCRQDDYLEAQANKYQQIADLQDSCGGIPILVAGDVFDKWKPSPFLLHWALEHLPSNIYAIPGNHDLPAHSISRYDESGFAVLEAAGKIRWVREAGMGSVGFDRTGIIYGFHYGKTMEPNGIDFGRSVAMIHEFVYKGRAPFPGATGKISGITQVGSSYDLVLIGDNHKPFTHREGKTLYVNPGSLTRRTADQINHLPRVYLYYAETNEVEPVYLDVQPDAVSREHIDISKDRADRIDEFVNRLKMNITFSISFEENIKNFLLANDVPKPVEKKIMKAING